MSRDFVPCLYRESDQFDAAMRVWIRRYEVVEAFQVVDRHTRGPSTVITKDSHVYALHLAETVVERLAAQEQPWRIDRNASLAQVARDRLFATFYAAMAALE